MDFRSAGKLVVDLQMALQNFDEVLVPADHISRSPNDTYYVDPDTVLRCHTSAHQTELLRQGEKAFLVTGDARLQRPHRARGWAVANLYVAVVGLHAKAGLAQHIGQRSTVTWHPGTGGVSELDCRRWQGSTCSVVTMNSSSMLGQRTSVCHRRSGGDFGIGGNWMADSSTFYMDVDTRFSG